VSIAVVVVVIVVVAVVVGLALRSRSSDDGVDSFRRQIDALSPEARKPTVDQVKSAERSDPHEAIDDDVDGSGGPNGTNTP
jgi:hypothetical protein